MTMRRTTCLLSLFAAAACAVPPDEDTNAYATLMAAMSSLQSEQQRFTAATPLPQHLDFPGQGRVTVRQLSLDGYPGNTYVRCRFHYANTTGREVLRALVSLDVLDTGGRLVASQVSVCLFPTPRAIHDGTFFADELRTQTHDVHLQAGWSWRITCKTEFMDDDEEPRK
jgi:hypothetical protein